MNKKILVGVPPINHVNLAMDEVNGLRKIGYSCDTITYTRNNSKVSKVNKLFGVLSNAFNIVKRLHRTKPDILYLNSRFGPIGTTRDFLSVFLIRLLYWRSLAITIKTHGSDMSVLIKKTFFFNSIVIPYLSKNVMLWFFLSQEEKNDLVKFAPKLSKTVYVTANIIDPKRSLKSNVFLSKYNLDDNRFKFFFAGRMIKEKGIFSIIRAIPKFKYKENCVFIFVGNGLDYEEFKTEIKRNKLEGYVHLTDFLPEEECDHFYANVDALVFPTYFDEGFPMALFKSISCGLPVITTKTRAAIDYLNEPKNCLWVDGRSPDEVAHALNTLYNDPVLRNDMAKNNLLLGKSFTQEKVTMQMSEDFMLAYGNN